MYGLRKRLYEVYRNEDGGKGFGFRVHWDYPNPIFENQWKQIIKILYVLTNCNTCQVLLFNISIDCINKFS
ncbi:hypothetical protein DHD05_05875 [Arenibacter sp. N53]|nr:hypothetical protein [Arenibacter sp. N53]